MKLSISRLHVSMILGFVTILGVGMIALSNSSELLPDPFDPARPNETWGCCMAPPQTTNSWRWPLFIIGTLMLLGAAWGAFLARNTPVTSQSPLHPHTTSSLRQRFGRSSLIGCAVIIWLFTLLMLSLWIIFVLSGGATPDIAIVHALLTMWEPYAWLTLAASCLVVPLLVAYRVGSWRTQCFVALYTISLCWLLMDTIAPNHHLATTLRGHYPLDIILFNHFLPASPILVVMAAAIGYWIIVGSILAWQATKKPQPAPSDTPS